MRHIPNFITSLNLASGFTSVIFAAEGNIVTASWFILIAMVFDFLDGFTARLLNAYSPVGKDLDSLADLVSFGLAPSLILFRLLAAALALPSDALSGSEGFLNTLIILSPALMTVSAALRLAIFNNDTSQATTFRGLPTPANALGLISLVLAGSYGKPGLADYIISSPLLLLVLLAVLSVLMVSRVPLLSFKIKHLHFRGNTGKYILVSTLAAAFIISGINAAPLILPVYFIASAVEYYFDKV
jgi:CDP-diacylglycerol--serine O-phosphatidyltransferase